MSDEKIPIIGEKVEVTFLGMCKLCNKPMYDEYGTAIMNKDIGIIGGGYQEFEIKAHQRCIDLAKFQVESSKSIHNAYLRGKEEMLKGITSNLEKIYADYLRKVLDGIDGGKS